MLKKYKTVFEISDTEIIEKKSRFIAHVKPVLNEEEAEEFVLKIKKENYNASHNVFAYQIGQRNEIKRCSDDGEPAKTAGVPILSILENEDIKNVVVVVTRYFGGTLLGTGGLVRAYQLAAKEGLNASKVIEKTLTQKISITSDYTLSGKIQYSILNEGHILIDTIYSDCVEFITLVLDEKVNSFLNLITDLTSGTVEPKILEKKYIAYIEDELIIFDT